MRLDEAEARASVASGDDQARRALGIVAGADSGTAAGGQTKSEGPRPMEAVVERSNMWLAYERVVRNKGAAGVDDLAVSELKGWLKRHWPRVKEALLSGEYVPQPVRKVDIPKPSGGIRTLGIPTVVDRLIQQALLQVLQPQFEPQFSQSSYGFRPGRSAHQALKAAQAHVQAGRRWVVDIDLEKFFDRVNHDILMARVARHVGDMRVRKLIRRYLEAGMMAEGVMIERSEGTPQGGPLSPLLANILLTDLDRELEARGHRFCRYADDCNVYVASRRAAQRVLASLSAFLKNKLRLTVNEAKSAVAQVWERKFLGYRLSWHPKPKLWMAPASRQRLTEHIRERLQGARGRSLAHTIEALNPLLRGWASYFRLAENRAPLEQLDGWVRRKLRCLLWRQGKRVHARARRLIQRGLSQERAWRSATNGRGPWWNSGASHMNAAFPKSYFDALGLVSLLDTQRRLQRVS